MHFFWMVLVSFVIDCVQGKPEIMIMNDETKLACDSSTLLTCNVTSEIFSSLYWYVNGNKAGKCSSGGVCSSTSFLPEYYTIRANTTIDRLFLLEIDPITFDDNIEVFCTDSTRSDTLTLSSINVISKNKFRITNLTDGDNVTFEVISNCVDCAQEITFALNTKSDTERSFDDVMIKNTTSYVNCSNRENPNCGGNATNKAKHTITIQTDSGGYLYTFQLSVSYKNDTILFGEIGPYRIKSPSTTTTSFLWSCSYACIFIVFICVLIFFLRKQIKNSIIKVRGFWRRLNIAKSGAGEHAPNRSFIELLSKEGL